VKRGDIVTVAAPGDYGKPRPALVVQSDLFGDVGSLTVLLISSTLLDAPLLRITVEPTPQNGLRKRSQIMVDKAISLRREKIGASVGRLEPEALLEVTRSLAVFFGIA
jgi:mRNA interferase MazF